MTESICPACDKPIGIPPRVEIWWTRIKGFFGISSYCYRNYCTMAPIFCEKCNSYNHFGCVHCD